MKDVVLEWVTIGISAFAILLSVPSLVLAWRANRTATEAYELDASAASRASEFQDVELQVRYQPQEQGATMWLTNVGSTDARDVSVIATVGNKRSRFRWGDLASGETKAVSITARVNGDGTFAVPSPFKIVWHSPLGTLREEPYTVPQIF